MALNARSWLNVGYSVQAPQVGDVVVLWRDSIDSWQGHVGFFLNRCNSQVYLIGGNQSNSVSVQAYDIERVLSYRRLSDRVFKS